MPYNPEKHHRRSIRLKGYDYAQAGLYFITICCQDRAHLFGHVENEEMILNAAGRMVVKWYAELGRKFPDIKCDEMIVMPNHMHFIVQNVGPVGADLRVCPENTGKHIGSPLHGVVQWLKTMSTNEYIRGVKTLGWPPFNGKLWQRNYWEHIIRNEAEYQRIAHYIRNNPKKWQTDRLNRTGNNSVLEPDPSYNAESWVI